eukprot:9333607-Alexandrium_andersonii.AAC.1
MAADFIHKSMLDNGALTEEDPGFIYYEAIDYNVAVQTLLANFPENLRPKHIFGDIVRRLPQD